MLAETTVAALRKGTEGCFTCGDENHLKRDCPKKANKKSALAAVEECIGPKIVNLNLTLKGNLFQELQAGDPPGPLQQKPETNSIFSSSAAVDILALNNFLLYPQAVPSRIPTGLFGSLPPQTFDLLLG